MAIALITGISGQDGAYLSKLLLDKGYAVTGLLQKERTRDFYRLKYLGIEARVSFRELDLMAPAEVKSTLAELQADEIYNLAALSSVGQSFLHPAESFEFNTGTVINILEAIRTVSQKSKFYQASSSEMFGNVRKENLPLKESLLFNPASPYGISKASAHWLTVNYREAFKINACCGILFNHESALRPPGFVIKKIVRTAVEIKHGAKRTLSLGNLSVVRDFGYAPMYVEAMWRMMQQDYLSDYLICSGNQIRLKEFVDRVFASLDLDAKEFVQTDPSLLRAVDLEVIYGDNSKAKRDLGWNYNLTNADLITRLVQDEMKFMTWQNKTALAI